MVGRAELSQRTLYTAGAAYAAALTEAGEGEERLVQIARDADRVFDRRLAEASEG